MSDAAAPDTRAVQTNGSVSTPIQVARRFLDRLAANDLDGTIDLVADDIVYTNVSLPSVKGHDNVRRVLAGLAGQRHVRGLLPLDLGGGRDGPDRANRRHPARPRPPSSSGCGAASTWPTATSPSAATRSTGPTWLAPRSGDWRAR